MFRKIALPITLPILLVTLLFGILKTTSQAQEVSQPEQPAVKEQIVLPPFTNTYRIGILSDITTLNVWALHDTQQSPVNEFVLGDFYPSLYRFSDQQQAWVPYLASNFPTPLTPSMGYIVSQVPLKTGLQWSDGSPLTADDIAFTINTAITMSLGGEWQAYNNASLHHAEATSPLTLTLFYNVAPTIEQHQFGTLMGPIVSEDYWTVPVANALAQPNPIAYLYNFISANEPTAGPYTLFGQVQGFEIYLAANPHYALKGVNIRHYANGAYQETGPFGTFTAYGNPTGAFDLNYVYGPYFDEVKYSIYASEGAALAALAAADVDVILDTNALSSSDFTTLTDQVLVDGAENGRNQRHYLGLNHNRPSLGTTAFRQALSIWLDRQAIINDAGQDALPAWDLLPAGQHFWYTDTTQLGADLFPQQRVNQAVSILSNAGFTWNITPTWDINSQTLIPGEGLNTPTGTLESPLTLLAPVDDALLAAAALPLAQALNDLGLSVTAVLTDTPIFNDLIWTQQAFDLFLADWDLDNTPSHLCAPFTSTPANISGYANPMLDTACSGYLSAPDLLAARPYVWQMQTILANDLPYLPLFTLPLREAYRFDHVHYPYTDALDGLGGRNGLTAVARPVISATIRPDIATTLIYTGTQGARIVVEVGSGSVARTYVMLFTSQTVPGYPLPAGQQFINHAFDLEVPYNRSDIFLPYLPFNSRPGIPLGTHTYLPLVLQNEGNGLGVGVTAVPSYQPQFNPNSDSFFFLKPITITVQYRDSDVIAVDEDTLQLLYWSGQEWHDAGTTCDPNEPSYANDPTNNILKVNLCHFSRFATAGN